MRYYTLPHLQLDDHDSSVIVLQRKLRIELTRRGHQPEADSIHLGRVFDDATREGVSVVNRIHGVEGDSAGPETWIALGFKEHNLRDFTGYTLRGVAWQSGVVKLDGTWVPSPIARALLTLRASGRWTGKVLSGWRPDWVQLLMWKVASERLGSQEATGKYVAQPGRSNHRYPDDRCPVDVTRPEQITRSNPKFYAPQSYLPGHLCIRYPNASGEVGPVESPTEDQIRTALAYIETTEIGIQ